MNGESTKTVSPSWVISNLNSYYDDSGGGKGAEPYDSYNHADSSGKFQVIPGTTTVILNFVFSAGRPRCLVFLRRPRCLAVRKCMRELRGRGRDRYFCLRECPRCLAARKRMTLKTSLFWF